MLITRAEIEGRGPWDVRLAAGRVAVVDTTLARLPDETVLDAAGGALLPGLHDHHLHLLALAAARSSLRCGPPTVRSDDELSIALRDGARRATGSDWLRGIGYHESVAGALDRDRLDAWTGDRPTRIQHRSGALWMVNSAGAHRLSLDTGADHPGIERDARGRATGRLYRADRWLREQLGPAPAPDLSAVGRDLAAHGITGATDATPGNAAAELALFSEAIASGALPQRLVVMGAPALPAPADPRIERGAVKIVLTEYDLPTFDALSDQIAQAHANARPVAVHCVTRAELVLAVGAFAAAGACPGDRIEHASIAPPEVVKLLADLPLTVVTQPNFVRERGDAYAVEVEPGDRPWLYRCRAFDDAAVPLGGGTDAPFGAPDPWAAMRAAVDRRTAQGMTLGAGEALDPERALALFTSPADAPGGAPRRVEVGARADLCLLDREWSRARERLSRELVAATIRDGHVVFRA